MFVLNFTTIWLILDLKLLTHTADSLLKELAALCNVKVIKNRFSNAKCRLMNILSFKHEKKYVLLRRNSLILKSTLKFQFMFFLKLNSILFVKSRANFQLFTCLQG